MKKLISFVLLASFVLIGCSNKKEEEVVDKNPVATIEFENLGVMKFELMVDQAPQSVYNFIALANEGYLFCTYLPFGDDWYGYFMRRLAERPQNINLILKDKLYTSDNKLKKTPLIIGAASLAAIAYLCTRRKK